MFTLMKCLPIENIKIFCSKWRIKEFSIFGSFNSEEFDKNSDIDVLVDYFDDAKWSLFDVVDMREELKSIFGRNIDLVSKRAVINSKNKFRKDSILNSAKVIYEEAA